MKSTRKEILFLIFTLSGFSGIIYESIWSHYLKLFLGHAAYAQTLVLAIFMGGMAIGSALCSRYSTTWKNLFRGYASLEAVIGILALFFHPVFDRFVQVSFDSVLPILSSSFLVHGYKWFFSALLILPQSILLGMTFPLMSAAIIRAFPEKPGETIAMLYFTNSLGAATGVLVSGFFFVGQAGLPGTLQVAGVINLCLACIVLWLCRGEPPVSVSPVAKRVDTPLPSKQVSFYLLISALTGVASFIYEIGWIRMLSLVLGSSTHAFELMLSAFILGIAFGGLWIKKRIDLLPSPESFLGWVQIVMGILALSTLPVYANTFGLMKWFLEILPKDDGGYILFNLASHFISVIVMLPPTFCAGMTLPLLTHILIKRGYGEKSIGAVYTANTAGAILGVVFAVHLGMPLLGLKWLVVSGASIDMAAGFLVFHYLRKTTVSHRLYAAAVSILVSVPILLFFKLDAHKMASGVFRNAEFLSPDTQVIEHVDGKTATISMTEEQGIRHLRTNGKVDAAINMRLEEIYGPDEVTVALLAVLPMLAKPDAELAANIGMGSAITTHILLNNPHLKEVDTIEIEKAVVDVARHFSPRNRLAYADERSRIHIDDAKTFFSSGNKQYDLIISEPSNPWMSGTAGLFSEEFYRNVRRYLKNDGILAQWIQLYEIDTNLVASIIKAMSTKFEDYAIFTSNSADIIIIARPTGKIPSFNWNLLHDPGIRRELNLAGISTIQDIEMRRVANRKLLEPLLNNLEIDANSDYYPVLDLNAARARYLGLNARELSSLTEEPLPVLEMLGVSEPYRGETQISPSPYFMRASDTYQAMLLRDYYLYGISSNEYDADSVESLKKLRSLVRRLEICGGEAGGREHIDDFFDAAMRISAYLNPEEMAEIWRRVEVPGCSHRLSDMGSAWLAFMKAVSYRQADEMRELSLKLLKEDAGTSPPQKKYLVAASMLASLSLNDKETADKIWEKYREALYEKTKPRFIFRLLAALSRT